jgi:hypothetical protein
MPAPEWVALYVAATQLVEMWRIPLSLGEQIVRGAVESGDVPVRGYKQFAAMVLVPEIIPKQARPILTDRISLLSRTWRDLEIAWKEFLEYAPLITPSWVAVPSDEIPIASELKNAREEEILRAIKEAYDTADQKGSKPPNIKELPTAVKPLLEAKGYQASGAQIQKFGAAFKNRRRSPGTTLRSERRSRKR